MKHDRVGLIILASLTLLTNCGVDVPDAADNSTDGIVRGKTEKKLPQVVAVRINRFNGGWVLCTGTYFASRDRRDGGALPHTRRDPGSELRLFR